MKKISPNPIYQNTWPVRILSWRKGGSRKHRKSSLFALGTSEESSLGFYILQHSSWPWGAPKGIRNSKQHEWRRTGWGYCGCILICDQMGIFLGKPRNVRGEGLSVRVYKGNWSEKQELWLPGVFVTPFLSLGCWNMVILSYYHMRMPEMCQLCFFLMFPSPKSIFTMPNPFLNSPNHIWVRDGLAESICKPYIT